MEHSVTAEPKLALGTPQADTGLPPDDRGSLCLKKPAVQGEKRTRHHRRQEEGRSDGQGRGQLS